MLHILISVVTGCRRVGCDTGHSEIDRISVTERLGGAGEIRGRISQETKEKRNYAETGWRSWKIIG